jgi:hypothetical protein
MKDSGKQYSYIALIAMITGILAVHFLYYPKWNESGTEATISWDVSGYYMYLPAIFIYKDLRECKFGPEIIEKYKPSPEFDQVFRHESGNVVMKYSIGQAVMYAPFFAIAHAWAVLSPAYPADGFSFPYQFMISMGSLLVAILGLYFLWKILLVYFSDAVVAMALIALVAGTNYLNYTAIDGAMSHNYLFTLYTLIIWLSIGIYEKPKLWRFLGIGFCIGLAALTRPTEIIAWLIPLLWGVNLLNQASLRKRLRFICDYFPQILLSVVVCLLVGAVQIFYWKYTTGNWIVYSYQDQGFSWIRHHIFKGLFSYNNGWFNYTPLMLFVIPGFIFLYRRHKSLVGACLAFTLLFVYIAYAWDIWWYGGSLGQRTMIQAYPILMFPLAAFIAWSLKSNTILKSVVLFLAAVFIYFNLWVTHQAHHGGLYLTEQMTAAYYWKIAGRYSIEPEYKKLLDNPDVYTGERKNVQQIYRHDLQGIENYACANIPQPDHGFCIRSDHDFSPVFTVEADIPGAWLRAFVDVTTATKEHRFWAKTQFALRFFQDDVLVKSNAIRMQRLLDSNETKTIWLDAKVPRQSFNRVEILFWNPGSNREILLQNLVVESYDD